MIARLFLWTLLLIAPAQAHDIYEDWKSPETGESCCNNKDCHKVKHRFVGRTLEVFVQGVWVPVNRSVLLAQPSQDGSAHACFVIRWNLEQKPDPELRCVQQPGGQF